jgi:putative acetyltransferase
MIAAAKEKDFPVIIELWERSVRATHHFLPEEYLQQIKTLMPSILPAVQLFILHDRNQIAGFLGIAEKKIEMLFIHPDSRGKGIGRQLTEFAIHKLQANKVDVNVQNEHALGFYQRMGFVVTGRGETDGLGKPYPLLLMELRSQ